MLRTVDLGYVNVGWDLDVEFLPLGLAKSAEDLDFAAQHRAHCLGFLTEIRQVHHLDHILQTRFLHHRQLLAFRF
jgi:hypothetical protein